MFREETPRVVEASPQILCFKTKALFSVGIWVAPRLPRTSTRKFIHQEANNVASGRRGLVKGVGSSKHPGQGWHRPWHHAGLGGGGGKEGEEGKREARVVQNMFSSHSPWVPWPPSSDGTSVP